MEVRPLDDAYHARLAQRIAVLTARAPYVDQFTQQDKP
jgi:hypothetical protein